MKTIFCPIIYYFKVIQDTIENVPYEAVFEDFGLGFERLSLFYEDHSRLFGVN